MSIFPMVGCDGDDCGAAYWYHSAPSGGVLCPPGWTRDPEYKKGVRGVPSSSGTKKAKHYCPRCTAKEGKS